MDYFDEFYYPRYRNLTTVRLWNQPTEYLDMLHNGGRLPVVGDGKGHSVVKVMRDQLSTEKIKQLVDYSDYVIINYRKNVIRSYASALLARSISSHKNTDTTNIKVKFTENSFNEWKDRSVRSIRSFKDIVKNKREVTYVCYEELHALNIQEKFGYILPPSWNLATKEPKEEPPLKRQNKNQDIYSSFTNPEVAMKYTKSLDANELWDFIQ